MRDFLCHAIFLHRKLGLYIFLQNGGKKMINFQDDDTSYLDEATRAPDAPHREPGADSVATDKDGVLVDEFGLPKIPAQ